MMKAVLSYGSALFNDTFIDYPPLSPPKKRPATEEVYAASKNRVIGEHSDKQALALENILKKSETTAILPEDVHFSTTGRLLQSETKLAQKDPPPTPTTDSSISTRTIVVVKNKPIKAKAPKKIKAPRKPRKIVEAASEEDEETQSVDGPTSQYETSNAEVIALELRHQKELKALTASNEKNQAKAIAEAVAEARDEERRVAEKLLGINILWLYLNLFTLHC